jgi:hypothetical protein
MEYKSKAQKLLELRAKTDRELRVLFESLLERGRRGDAERLLPLLRGAERRHFESKLTQVKQDSSSKSVYAA